MDNVLDDAGKFIVKKGNMFINEYTSKYGFIETIGLSCSDTKIFKSRKLVKDVAKMIDGEVIEL